MTDAATPPNDEEHLPDWVRRGAIVRLGKSYQTYGGNRPGTTRIHIRGIVDDMIVFCYWSFRKGYWKYDIMDGFIFAEYVRDGMVELIRRAKPEKRAETHVEYRGNDQ